MIGVRTLLAVIALATFAGRATAGEADVAEARDAFRRGSALAKSGDWEAALVAFERSARLKPHPVTTYDIAYCERALGHYARAAFRFAEALAAPSDGTAALPADLAHDATGYLDEVRHRVVKVLIARKPENTTIRVDGSGLERMEPSEHPIYAVAPHAAAVERTPAGPLEVWLDPGTHVFVASGQGDAHVVESRTFAAGESGTLTLALPASVSVPSLPRTKDDLQPHPDRTAAFIAFGVAGVGLAGSTIFGALALSEKHSLDADPACAAKKCPPSFSGRESRMVTFADLATAGLITLGVGAAAGTYFLLTASAPKKAAATSVVPWFAGTSAGISGRF